MALSSGNGSSSGIRAGSAYVALTSDTSQYDTAMNRAQRRLRQFQQSANGMSVGQSFAMLANRLNSFGDSLGRLGTRMVLQATAAIGALSLAVRQFMRDGDRLDKMAARTGASASWLSAMDYAAQRSGATLEDVEKALRQIAKTSQTSVGRDALYQLGLDARNFLRYRPQAQLESVLSRLALVRNAAERSRLAMELFGRTGTMLVPLAGHVGELVSEAERLGIVWSPQEVKDAAAVTDSWTTLSFVFRRAAALIGGALVPTIRDLTRWLYNNARTVADWLKRNQHLVRLAAGLASAWLALGVAAKAAGLAFKTLAAPILAVNAVVGGVKSLVGFFRLLGVAAAALSTSFAGFAATVAASLPSVLALSLAVMMAWDGVVASARSAQAVMASGWNRVGETVRSAFAAGLRLLASGEYQRGFGLIAKSAKLSFRGVFRDFAAGWYGLVAEVQEDWLLLCYACYEGWTWFVAQVKHSWSWFAGDMEKIGVAIGYTITTALSASWVSLKNFFGSVAGLAKKFIAELGLWFTELGENVTYGFKVAYYWSKRILPGYGKEDYERDMAEADAKRITAIGEARAKAMAAIRDASEEYSPESSFAEAWKEGMDKLEQRLKEIGLNNENIDAERDNALAAKAKEIWDKIQKIRELEMQDIAGLDTRIEELKAEIAADTAALDEYLQPLDQSATTGYLPDIADDVSRIAANTEPTAAFNADAIAARWRGALGVVTTPFQRFAAQFEQIRGGTFDYSSGTSDRDRMDRLRKSIDNFTENIRRLETAKADGIGTGRIENELAEVIRGLAANGRDFRQYANAMRQNLTFA